MDNNKLYTLGKEPEPSSSIGREIKQAILSLQTAFPDQEITALNWDENYIAVPLEVKVNLPSRRSDANRNILRNEPIYLLFHRDNYPFKAPSVHYNRLDFPANKYPHINPRSIGKTPSFCLYRGNIDNWFIEHTVVDIVKRASQWMSDAAGGCLIRKEDRFEATRLDEIAGCAIYDPSSLRTIINKNWRRTRGKEGFTFILYKLLNDSSKENSAGNYNIILIDTPNNEEINEIANQINIMTGRANENGNNAFLFGILAWPRKSAICEEFFAELPTNLTQMEQWTKHISIPLVNAIRVFSLKGLCLCNWVPITLAIHRPQMLIGVDSKIELLNFMVNINSEFRKQKDTTKAKVECMNNLSPLTLNKAREISTVLNQDNSRLLLFGCGAIGSKLALHLARSGQCNMTLIDHDRIYPHNLVRHALLSDSIGQNKADAVKKAIEELFGKKETRINIQRRSALEIILDNKNDIFDNHKYLVDSTASPVILEALCKANLPKTISCYRCEIADNGQLGFLYQEGPKRNPRLDDLRIHMYYVSMKDEMIADWLKRTQMQSEQYVGSILEEISIGNSCSSETMKLADDIVSLHAAYFSLGLQSMLNHHKQNHTGHIQINYYNQSGISTPIGTVLSYTKQINVGQLDIIKADNDKTWQVRITNGIRSQLHALFRESLKNETGGVLIGVINKNTKTIYVTDILKAPPDSENTSYSFKSGVQNRNKAISEIESTTGKIFGYVGEWHTHPNGNPDLSMLDKRAIDINKKDLDSIAMPTHIMIVTNKGIHSYIF